MSHVRWHRRWPAARRLIPPLDGIASRGSAGIGPLAERATRKFMSSVLSVRSRGLVGILTLALAGGANLASAAVNLEWRPNRLEVDVDEPFQVSIYAVSDGGGSQAIGSIDAVFSWGPSQLDLLEVAAPCTQEPCLPGTYAWAQLGFPSDENLDGLNNTWSDGNAYLQAVARPGSFDAAFATPQGLRVALLTFRAKIGGSTAIQFHGSLGSFTHTRVLSGQFVGLDITGQFNSQALVEITQCGRPIVEAIGSRYLKITAGVSPAPVALLVRGDIGDPRISCLSKFVQLDGSLATTPVYQTAQTWGTMFVSDIDVRPSSKYSVRTDCRQQAPNLFSASSDVTTARWGDVNGNGSVGIDDVTGVLAAAQGQFPPGAPPERYDLVPCIADGIIDGLDVEAVVFALQQVAFGCADPCMGPHYDDVAGLVECMTGPGGVVSGVCQDYDFDADDDCDLSDVGRLQRSFSGIGFE